MWLSKKQNSVETLNFGSKFTALKLAVELVIALRYKLQMFEVLLEGPTEIFIDFFSKNTYTPEYVLINKHHIIEYHQCIEAVAALIFRITKEDTETNLAYLFTNIMGRTIRKWLLNLFTY